MRRSQPFSRAAFWAAAVLLGLVWAGCGPSAPPEPPSPQEIYAALQQGLRATGYAKPESRTQYYGMGRSSYQAWELSLTLENQSAYPLTFGNELILFEADASGGTYDGVVLALDRGESEAPGLSFDADVVAPEHASFYSVSNVEVRYRGGGKRFQRGGTVGITFSSDTSDEEIPTFGSLEPGQSRTLEEDLELGVWLKDEHRASLRVVLPELEVKRAGAEPARFGWVLYFRQPGPEETEWRVNRQDVFWLEAENLERLVSISETNQVTRVLAANWLMDVSPARAGTTLVQVAQGLAQGDLLAVCLKLLARERARGLDEHAMDLLNDAEAPNGIRRLAAEYLGAIRHEPAVAVLAEKARDKDETIATAAIEGLGLNGGAEASAALLKLAESKAGREHREEVLNGLARTRQPDAQSYLAERAHKNDEEAFDALVREGASESFELFLELAKAKAYKDQRDQLARGLVRSGGERASEVLMSWLEEEELRHEDSPLITSTVVKQLATLSLPSLVPRLLELSRSGHLPAVQVLAHYRDPSAREPLQSLARETQGTAHLIALHGLSSRWPDGAEDLFVGVFSEPSEQSLRAAVRGLKKTKPDTLPSLLLPLLGSDDEDMRRQAASALSECDPGPHAEAYVQALLGTTDDQVAEGLVEGLIHHGWKDTAAIPSLAMRMEKSERDMQFQLIRLLRHLSDDAMGPEDNSEFSEEPEQWVARWLEWAKS